MAAYVWTALDRAVERASELVEDPDGRARATIFLSALCGAIRQMAPGEPLGLEADRPPGATLLLDRTRRFLAEELKELPSGVGPGGMHLLSALAQARSILADGWDNDSRRSGAEALDLAVEVAHDMRSPLAAILFLVDALRSGRSGAVTRLQQQQLGMVYAAAFGLNQLARDLVDYVRADPSTTEPRPIPFSVPELLHSVRDMVLPMAVEKNLEVHVEAPEACVRLGSPMALGRVILNLASNAVRYTKAGSVLITAWELDEQRLGFAVKDSGGAIPSPVMDELYRPFRHSEDGVRAFSSAGMGLAICHRLVRSLGGELRVSPDEAEGARFWFEIPAHPANVSGSDTYG